jgi:hypothetical protein
MRNFELGLGDRNIQIPAKIIAEDDPVYRAHYENRVARLGADHPVIETQYHLVDLDAVGGAFKPHHRASLFDSDHGRQDIPSYRAGCVVVTVIDIAGEEEEDERDLDENQSESWEPDATVIIHAEVDQLEMVGEKPKIRILEAKRVVGMKMQPVPGDNDPTVQELIIQELTRWRPKVALIDSKGIGHGTASWLSRVWPGNVVRYAANTSTASEDVYETYAYLNLGQLKWWRDDGSEEYREMQREMSWAQRKISAADKANIIKPTNMQKIDMVKCLTYIPRAASEVVINQVFGYSTRL